MTSNAAKMFGIEPVMAMVSYSNFGSSENETAEKVRNAVEYLHRTYPDMIVDGELQADFALNSEMLTRHFSFFKISRAQGKYTYFSKFGVCKYYLQTIKGIE